MQYALESLVQFGWYLLSLPLVLAPFGIWFWGRRRFRGVLWPLLVLHATLLGWFLITWVDRYEQYGFESIATLIFTLCLLLYPLMAMMILLTSRHLNSGLACWSAIGVISLIAGTTAFLAAREFRWHMPGRHHSTREEYHRSTPMETGLIVAVVDMGFLGLVGFSRARKRKKPLRHS